jgi:hypothetical protein
MPDRVRGLLNLEVQLWSTAMLLEKIQEVTGQEREQGTSGGASLRIGGQCRLPKTRRLRLAALQKFCWPVFFS